MKEKKHYYHKFDDSVPEDLEKYFNKLTRKEEYLYEKDPISKAIFFGDESELYKYNIASRISYTEMELEIQAQLQKDIEYLRKALEQLKKSYPLEYAVIQEYYFSDENKSLQKIADKRKVSKQAISKILKFAYIHLKKYINSYKLNS